MPTLSELNDPTVTTSNVRVYDYVQGKTVTATQITGGNPNLKADDRHVFKLGLSLAPISSPKLKLNLTADYIHSVTRNAIGTLSSATAAAEEAFPDRFERDEDGNLVSEDSRSVNFDREDRSEIRWGFNFTRVLRASKRPPPPPGFRPSWLGEHAPDGVRGPDGAPLAAPDQGDAASGGGVGDQANRGNGSQEIVVNGKEKRDSGDAFGPPGGMGSPDGMGPPDGVGPPDGPPPDGMPPPPSGGGFGPPGGPGGHRGPPGGYGGNGAQFQLSVYHSWYFRDDVRLSANGPVVDLLNGGTIGAGGQARHKIQLNVGIIDNGVGLQLSGSWISATRVNEGEEDTGVLHYSSLATFDLRLFADLGQRFKDKEWARGTRLSLSIGNVFNTRQRVRDANGDTPLVYQPGFLDPYGRTIGVTLRRML